MAASALLLLHVLLLHVLLNVGVLAVLDQLCGGRALRAGWRGPHARRSRPSSSWGARSIGGTSCARRCCAPGREQDRQDEEAQEEPERLPWPHGTHPLSSAFLRRASGHGPAHMTADRYGKLVLHTLAILDSDACRTPDAAGVPPSPRRWGGALAPASQRVAAARVGPTWPQRQCAGRGLRESDIRVTRCSQLLRARHRPCVPSVVALDVTKRDVALRQRWG